MPDEDLRAALDRLTAEMALLNRREKFLRMLGTNLLRGLAFGLGSVLGASLLVSILGWWVSQFEFLPLIGQWAVRVVDEINRARQ